MTHTRGNMESSKECITGKIRETAEDPNLCRPFAGPLNLIKDDRLVISWSEFSLA